MSRQSSPEGQGPASAAASTTTNKRGRAPASNEVILGLRQITAADYDFPSGECAICLQDFDFGTAEEKDALQLRALPCSHAFHYHCISRWLRCNAVCPLCRHQLPTEEDDYVDENMWLARRRRRVTELELSLAHPADFNGYVPTEPVIITEQVQEHQIHEQIDFEELNRILNEIHYEFRQPRNRHQTT